MVLLFPGPNKVCEPTAAKTRPSAERLPAAMVAAFDVAARAMAFAARRAAIRAWSELLAHACCQIYASVESGARLRREFGV
jgi:hypothetical protein